MKRIILFLTIFGMCQSLWSSNQEPEDPDKYPSTVISNDEVKMKVYLPDSENGYYRATRFEWSGKSLEFRLYTIHQIIKYH